MIVIKDQYNSYQLNIVEMFPIKNCMVGHGKEDKNNLRRNNIKH